jgi:hypothetical protein
MKSGKLDKRIWGIGVIAKKLSIYLNVRNLIWDKRSNVDQSQVDFPQVTRYEILSWHITRGISSGYEIWDPQFSQIWSNSQNTQIWLNVIESHKSDQILKTHKSDWTWSNRTNPIKYPKRTNLIERDQISQIWSSSFLNSNRWTVSWHLPWFPRSSSQVLEFHGVSMSVPGTGPGTDHVSPISSGYEIWDPKLTDIKRNFLRLRDMRP